MTKFAVAPGITVDDSVLVAQGSGWNALMVPLSLNPSNPTGTTSLTGVMMGIGAQGTPSTFTPILTGRVRILWTGRIKTDTSPNGALVNQRYGTGAAPANAAAPTGTAVGSTTGFLIGNANNTGFAFTLDSGLITGLTVGTLYWADLDLAAVTAGTASLTNLFVSVQEG